MRARETIRSLNRLIASCRRAEVFCRGCAQTRGASQLRSVLRHRSDEWGRYGDELQALVLMLGGDPVTGNAAGSWALRRAWLAGKALLLGPTEALVLEEWQHEQRRVLHRYEEALKGYLARRIRRTVAGQATRIQQRLQQIDCLRLEYALGSANVSRV